MRTIEVSDDVFRRLQELAEPFVDTPEDVLRRLLDLGETRQAPVRTRGDVGADLVSRSGRVPHGARLRGRYKGREFTAEIRDGRVIWNDQAFDSLSSAAIAVIQSTGARRPTENGWRFWEVQEPGREDWREATHYQAAGL